jgi:hypothetical protein
MSRIRSYWGGGGGSLVYDFIAVWDKSTTLLFLLVHTSPVFSLKADTKEEKKTTFTSDENVIFNFSAWNYQ